MNEEDRKVVARALDALALALAGHNHTWTPEQRSLYEQAVALVLVPYRDE